MRPYQAALLLALQAAAPASAAQADGAALYARHCEMCHAPGDGHPGTMRLHARAGAEAAVLLERRDLVPGYVAEVVRRGFQMMPPFRPTEITDDELERLAGWVAAGGKAR